MQILRALARTVDELLDLRARLPSVEALRPKSCPGCGYLAYGPDGFGIVGHGVYWRQVLGVVSPQDENEIPIRRYVCGGCEQTISVLPDLLYPGRWYAGAVILEALRLHLVDDKTEGEVRVRFGLEVDPEAIWWSWRSLRRWRRQLLARLWDWLAARLGVQGPAEDRAAGRQRVVRLLREADEEPARGDAGLRAAPRLGSGTVHSGERTWPLGRDPPGDSSPGTPASETTSTPTEEVRGNPGSRPAECDAKEVSHDERRSTAARGPVSPFGARPASPAR
jgi:hypothetical protein